MRTAILIPLCAVLVLPACMEQPPDTGTMIASAKAIDEEWAAAFNEGELDRLMALYWNSSDLLLYPTDVLELRGWENARTFYKEMMENMEGATVEIGSTEYLPAGDAVISHGLWTITVATDDGPVFTIRGRFSDVRMMKEGRWVIIREHGSVPMPPPAGDVTL